MNTLYDILGLGRSATPEQVDQAYQIRINKIKSADQSTDQDMIQLRAVKEAYGVLSSPARRAAYDSKLNAAAAPRVTYEAVDSTPMPWFKIVLVAVLLIGGGFYYQTSQTKKARIAQLALETEKAKAEAEKVAKLAEIEAARLEQARVRDLQQAEARQRMQSEQARREGQQIHAQMQQLDSRIAREDSRIAREKAAEESRERYAQLREEQAARSRVQQQNAAMQRALNMPVGGQSGGRAVTIQPRSTDMRR